MARQSRRLFDTLRRRPDLRASAADDGTIGLYRPGEILVAVELVPEALARLRELDAHPEEVARLPGNLVVLRVPADRTEVLARQLCVGSPEAPAGCATTSRGPRRRPGSHPGRPTAVPLHPRRRPRARTSTSSSWTPGCRGSCRPVSRER